MPRQGNGGAKQKLKKAAAATEAAITKAMASSRMSVALKIAREREKGK